jgi:predicted dehydrogenase
MATRSIRIIMEGVTGRLGTQQHLIRSLLAIRSEGGLPLADGDRLMPEPVLLGRNPDKLAALAASHGGLDWSTSAEDCLADPRNEIYFDVSATGGRVERARRALAAGRHIYLEKPIAGTLEEALDLARTAERAGLKHGTVQDKLFLPGFRKMRSVRDAGLLGRILSVRIDFGWWIFDGELHPSQRSSWNYKRKEGGGLILDMFPHWRYIVDNLFGRMSAVSCRYTIQQPRRRDEAGREFAVDVEDEAFATVELEGGPLVQINASWATRPRRDDMLTVQVDGTLGSAVCGLHRCFVQPLAATPKPIWNIEVPRTEDLRDGWQEVPDVEPFRNSYRAGWEPFLRHVVEGAPFAFPLIEGAKGVQLAEACYRSHVERRWIEMPNLSATTPA